MLWPTVWEHNARARRFYERWEFRIVGETGFQRGAEQQTDLLMERAVELS